MEMEVEEERKRQSHLARFEHDKAVLAANKKAAVAKAKLKAIEQAIEDEDNEKVTLVTIPGFTDPVDTKEQTHAWINTQENPQETLKALDCVRGKTNPFDLHLHFIGSAKSIRISRQHLKHNYNN